MTTLVEELDRKLREWPPAKAAAVETLITNIIRLADTQPPGFPPGNITAKEWPPGYFDRIAGSLPDFPDLDFEGNYEQRQSLA
jgi:hypothetical protein